MHRAIVFTDLDGTLLDHHSYSWEKAEAGLFSLRRHGIPLVPSTSKTAAELARLATRIGFGPIGIVENGAGIVWDLREPERVEILGAPYEKLRRALREIRDELSLPLTGFGDVGADEIADRAGLQRDAAVLSRQRCGDEPFWSERELTAGEEDALKRAVTGRALRLTRGGRYFHLTGETDKGSAARRVIARFVSGERPPRTAAFGDAANDRSLLEAVDRSYAVRRPDGGVDAVLSRVPGVRITAGVGPAGFSEGIEDCLRGWQEADTGDPGAG